jgi:hypothetical protein
MGNIIDGLQILGLSNIPMHKSIEIEEKKYCTN